MSEIEDCRYCQAREERAIDKGTKFTPCPRHNPDAPKAPAQKASPDYPGILDAAKRIAETERYASVAPTSIAPDSIIPISEDGWISVPAAAAEALRGPAELGTKNRPRAPYNRNPEHGTYQRYRKGCQKGDPCPASPSCYEAMRAHNREYYERNRAVSVAVSADAAKLAPLVEDAIRSLSALLAALGGAKK